MNFFKTTLLSAIVVGLSYANVSAHDEQQDFQVIARVSVKADQDFDSLPDSDKEAVQEILALAKEIADDQANPDMRTQHLIDLQARAKHLLKGLGWLGLSGISGIITDINFVHALHYLGSSIQTINNLTSTYPIQWWAYNIPSYACNIEALYATGYAFLAVAFALSSVSYAKSTVSCLRNAFGNIKTAVIG